MKSYWIVTRGNASVLEPRDIPAPEPRQGEVVIRVHAAGLNRGELIVGGAVHGGDEKVGGSEASGVIVAVGDGVGVGVWAHMDSSTRVGKVIVRM